MDDYFFSKLLGGRRHKPEDVGWLEILNYSDAEKCTAEESKLDSPTPKTIKDFLQRRGNFVPRVLDNGTTTTDGIRLLLQAKAQNPEAFSPAVLSLDTATFQSLVTEFQLPLRCLESSSAVGPFFWWGCSGNNLQIIFRKSDAEWKGTSRGWELMLSYSFDTRMTSGYVKAMESFKFSTILQDLQVCGRPVTHPLLLPVLVLCHELSSDNDEKQREQRRQLRKLENALSQRYQMLPAAHYGVETDPELDAISRQLANCQCEVLQKRPQAWQNVLENVNRALGYFWLHLSEEEQRHARLEELHRTLESRLAFLSVKLEGIENYAHVSLERLSIHREVLHNIINQRESRLNFEIAIQQRRLAIASGRESTSMRTLTILGLVFLPGTFLSSLFGMPFFSFDSDMTGPVSKRLWIYFVLTVPLTAVIMGAWWTFDQRWIKDAVEDEEEGGSDCERRTETAEEKESRLLEARIMKNIRRRTGVKVADTFELQAQNRTRAHALKL